MVGRPQYNTKEIFKIILRTKEIIEVLQAHYSLEVVKSLAIMQGKIMFSK